jgi:hypothetical protein
VISPLVHFRTQVVHVLRRLDHRFSELAPMRLFPELVIEKLGQGILDVLVTRSRIIGGLGVIDQSRPLLRTDIENRRVISFGVLCPRQIHVIVIRKTKSQRRDRGSKESGSNSREDPGGSSISIAALIEFDFAFSISIR